MRIVVFEDNNDKFDSILAVLERNGVKRTSVFRAETVAQFLKVGERPFDLCIIDIRMPGIHGEDARNAGTEILEMLDYSGRQRVPVLAITAYAEEAFAYRDQFSARGCIIYSYDQPHIWHRALEIFVAQARDRGRYEFLIFTALQKERLGYAAHPGFECESVLRHGLDMWDCEINGAAGAIVLLPKMGLVTATAVVASALEHYAPRIVGMSGICAGIGSQTSLGQLLVNETCWEYQSGKWLDDAFEAEPLQVSIDQNTRAVLANLLGSPTLLKELEADYDGDRRPSLRAEPKMAVFTSGSAVIASEKRLEHVKSQHRRVEGIDMELFGFHRAVELSGKAIKAFSAKVVVDKADEHKDDFMHEYGSYISAGFCMRAVSSLLSV